MKIPPYWVIEKCAGCDGNMWNLRGISYTSMLEARERQEKRRRLREQFAQRRGVSAADVEDYRSQLRKLDELDADDYSVLLLEPVVNQIDDDNIITRNRYGALVLNSTELCFIDVDTFPLSFVDLFGSLLGKKVTPESKLLQAVSSLCAEDERLGARVYRTHKGWRVMISGADMSPDSERMHQICRALHADALYESLCVRQRCWRARLSPKPYRVGTPGYPRPMDSDAVNSPEAQTWIQRYDAASEGKAVCRLVDCFGKKIESHIVSLHDDMTKAGVPDLPLT